MDYLKVEELRPYYTYKIKARNGQVGIWRPDKGEFMISRIKFGANFTFGEIHWDLDQYFGTAKPLEELEESPFKDEDLLSGEIEIKGKKFWGNLKEEEILKYLNAWEEKLDAPHPREPYNGKK